MGIGRDCFIWLGFCSHCLDKYPKAQRAEELQFLYKNLVSLTSTCSNSNSKFASRVLCYTNLWYNFMIKLNHSVLGQIWRTTSAGPRLQLAKRDPC